MLKINDNKKLNYYINKYKINEIFSSDISLYGDTSFQEK